MTRKKSLLEILNDLALFYTDLNHLIIEYDIIQFTGKEIFDWTCPNEEDHSLLRIINDHQYLYINCTKHNEIYRYSFDGEFINSFPYTANAMEIINNQFYLFDDLEFVIVDIQTNSIIQRWNTPIEDECEVGGWNLKIDPEEEEKIYWIALRTDHIYLYYKNGTEIKKFGKKEKSSNQGEFNNPYALTVNQKCLYVCDKDNHRVQILDKSSGKFIKQWDKGLINGLHSPQSILLYDTQFYLGDYNGIYVISDNLPIQYLETIEADPSLCIVENKLYMVSRWGTHVRAWN